MAEKGGKPEKASSRAFQEFTKQFAPLEAPHLLLLLTDNRTGARFCECHIKASKLIAFATTDVPLDPEDQAEYRANRELVESAPAYARMIDDAKLGRCFSNLVAEFTKDLIGNNH